jgi:hypothetical protein
LHIRRLSGYGWPGGSLLSALIITLALLLGLAQTLARCLTLTVIACRCLAALAGQAVDGGTGSASTASAGSCVLVTLFLALVDELALATTRPVVDVDPFFFKRF